MRVDQSNNPVQSTETSGTQATKHTRKTKGANESSHNHFHGRGDSSVSSEVSEHAHEMAAAHAAAHEAPDVREDRIAELKSRIAGGGYRVDPNAVADRLVDDHIRMSGIG